MELLKVEKLNNSQDRLFEKCVNSGFEVGEITVDIEDSLGFIVSKDVLTDIDVPSFRRSTVDGYAVSSSDLSGASESVPSFLKIKGESKMGEICDISISSGECVYVPTGGMLPKNADAVVMVEYVENFAEDKIAVYQSVSTGSNIINIGDDNKKGDVLLKKGRKVTASDIGLMASNGISTINIFKPFNVSIISTGDEIVDVKNKKNDAQIYDINSYTINAECKKNNFEVKNKILLKDERELLEEKISEFMKLSDVVVISGGSSKGKKDNTANVIDKLCKSGVMIHGIAVKPGKPTIIGYDEITKTVVIGLPGHPVAAVLLFNLLVVWLYEKMTFSICQNKKTKVKCKMFENVMQSPGRTTFQLVNIDDENKVHLVLGKSGLINTMSRADGYIVIDENCEGINVGDEVDVYLI